MGEKPCDMAGKSGDQNRRAPPSGTATARLSGNAGASPRSAQDCAPCPRAARVQPRGCKGRSPLHKKTKNLPLPHGGRALCERGSGGWGKEIHDVAGSAGDQNRRAPHRGQRRQVYPATPGQAPRLAQDCAPAPAPPGFRRRGAGGGSPRRNKPKISPFPTGEERSASAGRGDRGKKFMMRQVQPATKTAVPPIGDSDGKVIRQRRGKPPARRRIAPPVPAPLRFSPGDARGEAPCVRKLKISPFPMGEERSASAGRGDGGKTL